MEISRLPRDVLLDILIRLPIKPLIRFSLSSKEYLSLIHHPHFINRHLTRLKSNPSRDGTFLLLCYYKTKCTYYALRRFTNGGKTLREDKRFEIPSKFELGKRSAVIVGSNNGLVCLSDTSQFPHPADRIILWNVFIGKYKILPSPYEFLTIPNPGGLFKVSIGFGFVLETNDFKVVQIMSYGRRGRDSDDQVPVVLVYSMELNTWRKIEANIALCPNDRFSHSKVYVNGAVHSLAYKAGTSSDLKSAIRPSIMSFDMKGEIFKEMALPNNLGNDINRMELFSSAGGESVSLLKRSKDSKEWEVWLMKEYGVVDSWTRQFCIAEELPSWPWNVMDNGDVLLEVKTRIHDHKKLVLWDESQRRRHLVLYDSKNQKVMDLGRDSMMLFSIVTCSPTLGLLDKGRNLWC